MLTKKYLKEILLILKVEQHLFFSPFTTTMKHNQIPSGEYGKRTTKAKSSHNIDMDNFSNYFTIY